MLHHTFAGFWTASQDEFCAYLFLGLACFAGIAFTVRCIVGIVAHNMRGF